MGSQTNSLGENYTKELEITTTKMTVKRILGLVMDNIDGGNVINSIK